MSGTNGSLVFVTDKFDTVFGASICSYKSFFNSLTGKCTLCQVQGEYSVDISDGKCYNYSEYNSTKQRGILSENQLRKLSILDSYAKRIDKLGSPGPEAAKKSLVNVTFLVSLSVGLAFLLVCLLFLYHKYKQKITAYFQHVSLEASIDLPINAVLPMQEMQVGSPERSNFWVLSPRLQEPPDISFISSRRRNFEAEIIEEGKKKTLSALDVLLERMKYEESKLKESCQSCAICFEDFEPDSLIRETPCCHIFHSQCLMGWLSSRVP